MNKSEIDLIRRALELLHRLVPDDEPRAGDPAPQRHSAVCFARDYLINNPASDLTCAELWRFYSEIVAGGELEPLSKAEFLRHLPGVMASIYGVKKCHSLKRDGQTVRGFRAVGIR